MVVVQAVPLQYIRDEDIALDILIQTRDFCSTNLSQIQLSIAMMDVLIDATNLALNETGLKLCADLFDHF